MNVVGLATTSRNAAVVISATSALMNRFAFLNELPWRSATSATTSPPKLCLVAS
jgi:hypothetical protein